MRGTFLSIFLLSGGLLASCGTGSGPEAEGGADSTAAAPTEQPSAPAAWAARFEAAKLPADFDAAFIERHRETQGEALDFEQASQLVDVTDWVVVDAEGTPVLGVELTPLYLYPAKNGMSLGLFRMKDERVAAAATILRFFLCTYDAQGNFLGQVEVAADIDAGVMTEKLSSRLDAEFQLFQDYVSKELDPDGKELGTEESESMLMLTDEGSFELVAG